MRLLFLLLYFLCLGALAATNQVTIIDPVQSQVVNSTRAVLQFGAYNRSSESQRLTAKVNTLRPGDAVGFYTKDKVINSDLLQKHILTSSNIRLSPKRLSLPPKQMRPFRVAVSLKKAQQGTYFGNLLVKQLPKKSNVVDVNNDSKPKDLSVNLNVLFDQYTAFYLNKGKGNPFEPPKGQNPVKIECTVDKENKNLTLHIYNDTSYALRSSIRSEAVSDKTYRVITVLPYTEATRDVAVPMKEDLKTPFKLDFLINNKEVSSVMCS